MAVSVYCLPFTVQSLFFTVHRSRFKVYFLPFTFYCSLFTSHLSSLISHLSSLTSHLSSLISHLSPLISHLSPLTSHLSPLTSTSFLSPLGEMSAGQRGFFFFFLSYPTLSGASHADKSAVVTTSVNLSASPDLTALTPATSRNLRFSQNFTVNSHT